MSRDDVYENAFRQLCRAEGRNIADPLESEFASVMRALEQALTEESGKTKRLNRTRQKLNRVGVRQTLADLALKPQPSMGFLKLVEFNMADMSAESLIFKYRDDFDQDVVSAASRRRNMLPPSVALSAAFLPWKVLSGSHRLFAFLRQFCV